MLKLEVRIECQEFPLVDVRDRIEACAYDILRHRIMASVSIITHVSCPDLSHLCITVRQRLSTTDYGGRITLLPLVVLRPDKGVTRLNACSSTDPPKILVAVNFLDVEVPELLGIKLGLPLLKVI